MIACKTNYLAKALTEQGFDVPPDELRSRHFFGIRPPKVPTQDIHAVLEAQNIFVSVRNGKLRLALHLWNDEDDLTRLLEALEACIAG